MCYILGLEYLTPDPEEDMHLFELENTVSDLKKLMQGVDSAKSAVSITRENISNISENIPETIFLSIQYPQIKTKGMDDILGNMDHRDRDIEVYQNGDWCSLEHYTPDKAGVDRYGYLHVAVHVVKKKHLSNDFIDIQLEETELETVLTCPECKVCVDIDEYGKHMGGELCQGRQAEKTAIERGMVSINEEKHDAAAEKLRSEIVSMEVGSCEAGYKRYIRASDTPKINEMFLKKTDSPLVYERRKKILVFDKEGRYVAARQLDEEFDLGDGLGDIVFFRIKDGLDTEVGEECRVRDGEGEYLYADLRSGVWEKIGERVDSSEVPRCLSNRVVAELI